MGYISALETVTEGIMCSLGYGNSFSGLCGALVFIGGLVGSFLFGMAGRRAGKRIVYIVKLTTLMMGLILVGMIFIMGMPDQKTLFALSYTAFGFFAIGYG